MVVIRGQWNRLARYGVALLGLAFGLGLFLFLHVGSHVPITVVLPALKAHPDGDHNLVALAYGPHLRASSYFRDPGAQHHPAFLVDGRAKPGLVEKWTSAPKDPAPWVELRWQGERQVHRVRIEHAGIAEAADLTSRSYTLTCLSSRPAPAVAVTDNTLPVAEHSLQCSGAHGVRIDFVPNSPGALVRVFEVEVWGK